MICSRDPTSGTYSRYSLRAGSGINICFDFLLSYLSAHLHHADTYVLIPKGAGSFSIFLKEDGFKLTIETINSCSLRE